MESLLSRVGFCHLGCVDGRGRPYVVPMNFAYDGESVYFFTTEGMKTENMEQHPEVCLQVEEIEDAGILAERDGLRSRRASRATGRYRARHAAHHEIEPGVAARHQPHAS